jgi:DNA-binding FadR family transcriptional regulator
MRLKAMLQNLDDHIQRYRTLSNYQSGRLLKSVEEHRHVVEAIQRGDPESAEQAIRAHILSVMDDLENQNIQELVTLASKPAV